MKRLALFVSILWLIPQLAWATLSPTITWDEANTTRVVEAVYFPPEWNEMKPGYKPRITGIRQFASQIDGDTIRIECEVTGDWIPMEPGEGIWIDDDGAPMEFTYGDQMVYIDDVITLVGFRTCAFRQ